MGVSVLEKNYKFAYTHTEREYWSWTSLMDSDLTEEKKMFWALNLLTLF